MTTYIELAHKAREEGFRTERIDAGDLLIVEVKSGTPPEEHMAASLVVPKHNEDVLISALSAVLDALKAKKLEREMLETTGVE